MKSINKFFAAIAIITCITTTAFAGDKGLKAKGGVIHYTLRVGNDIITTEAGLSEDSYVFIDEESNIVIADPAERFHIGIVKKTSAFVNETCKETNPGTNLSFYTVANYLVYDEKNRTMEALPFESGSVKIDTSDTGYYKVSFTYTLKEMASGKPITLVGEALLETQNLALQK